MKKLKMLLPIVVLFFTASVQAQMRVGVKTALNASNAYFKEDQMKTKNITGYSAGLSLETMVGTKGFGIETAVLYSEKGFNLGGVKARNNFVEIPVNVKYKFKNSKLNSFVTAGAYVGFLTSGEKSWQVRENETGFPRELQAQKANFGLNTGAGIEVWNGLQVAAMLDFGLLPFYKSTKGDYKGHPKSLALSVTYYF